MSYDGQLYAYAHGTPMPTVDITRGLLIVTEYYSLCTLFPMQNQIKTLVKSIFNKQQPNNTTQLQVHGNC